MKILLGILTILLLSYTSMFQKITVPNERTRVYLAAALVDDHSLSIDGPIRRFGKTADAAKFKGRYYTDKAPGSSLLGAAVYASVRIFSPSSVWRAESLITLMRTCVMIPIGVFGFLLLRRWLVALKVREISTDIASLGWILGTSAFHYSTAFYGHQIAAVSMMLAVYLVSVEKPSISNKGAGLRQVLSGAAAGFAGLTEYQSIIPAALLCVFVMWAFRRRLLQIGLFGVGALPFAVLLLLYNKLAFGDPFSLPYEHLASKSVQALHSAGIAGVAFPKAEAVFGSLFSLHRGLIATSPFFLLVPIGLLRMFRTNLVPLAALISAMISYYLLFIFSAEVWYAGWSFGPRLLVPVMGLMMIPTAVALEVAARMPILSAAARGLVAAGILYHQLVHVVFPEIPENSTNPVLDLIVPALERGILSPNRAAQLTGRPGLWTLAIPVTAVAAVLAIVLFRGFFHLQSLKQRVLHICISIGVIVSVFLAILISGPSWTSEKSSRFVDWMAKLEKAELSDERPGD